MHRKLLLFIPLFSLSLLAEEVPTATAPQKWSEKGYASEWKSAKKHPTLKLPFLQGYPNAKMEKRVNKQLQKQLNEMGCSKGDESTWTTKSEVSYAENDIYSLNISQSYACPGTPYPTKDGKFPMTFDLTKGQLVDFEKLFAKYKKNRREIFMAIYSNKIGLKNGECPSTLKELMQHPVTYYVVPKGIMVSPEFSHANEACAFEEFVPLAKLLPFAAPNGILKRIGN